MLKYNTMIAKIVSILNTAKQNQKFPFHFFFRFAAEGWGEETQEKCKEIFWFLHTRVRERVRGALSRITTQSERTRQFQATTRSARAKWVRAKANTSPPVIKYFMNNTFKLNVSVFLILRKKDEILFYKRIDTNHEEGKYSLVGGYLDGKETVQQGIAREAKEEIGIEIKPEDLTVVHVIHHSASGNYGEFFNVFLETIVWQGDPSNVEPDRCGGLKWFSIDDLPQNTVDYVRLALEQIRNKNFFSNFGW